MLNKASKDFVLESNRLKIREFKDRDLSIFLEYRSDPVLLEFQDFILSSKEEAIKFLDEQKEVKLGSKENWKQLAIVDLKDELIGDTAVKCDPYQEKIVELGITIRKEYHNQGLAFEALRLLIQYLFEEMNIHKIQAEIDVRNIASQRLFEKLNFNREAHMKDHYWDAKAGKWFDEYWYGLLNSDYSKNKN